MNMIQEAATFPLKRAFGREAIQNHEDDDQKD
jgi:hypothetical protein